MIVENEFMLSSEHSYATFHEIVKAKDTSKLAHFVGLRLRERYGSVVSNPEIDPFARLAAACLLMESIEGWFQGWATNRGKEQEAFRRFLGREFGLKPDEAETFYGKVRCGVLHQGETMGRWMLADYGEAIVFSNGKMPSTINLSKLAPKLENAVASLESMIQKTTWANDDGYTLWPRIKTTLDTLS